MNENVNKIVNVQYISGSELTFEKRFVHPKDVQKHPKDVSFNGWGVWGRGMSAPNGVQGRSLLLIGHLKSLK